MANRTLFQTLRGAFVPRTDAINDAAAPAYARTPQATLAQLAATGSLNRTFYASAETQLDRVLEAAQQVDTDFLARTALYARRRAFMKDMPALLCAVLATRDLDRLIEIFPQVIDNGRMLRTFVQILRSGVTGRKSLGSAPKRLVRQWLERASERQLIDASIGNAPSLADIVKMVHPRPTDPAREAFYAWLIGKPWNPDVLPAALRAFEDWKRDRAGEIPDVPFQMLTAQDLGEKEWAAIARKASWQTTRMNLNTFLRHGLAKNPELIRLIAKRLADPDAVRRARAFPYQLLVAFMNAAAEMPHAIKEALQDAMETALANVPDIAGRVVVCADVSGSMQCSVTGYQRGASSKVRCVDVAGLIAAAFLRKNRDARVLPFECDVVKLKLNPRDSVMTNAAKLAKIGGGGTNCSAPLQLLNSEKAQADLVIYVSDNESWMDARPNGRGTGMMHEWTRFKERNPAARLVCIDLVPNVSVQALDRKDILNIGGFSDTVFDLVAAFAAGADGTDHWISEIEKQPINTRMKIA
ncbi:TROVE domain-containing protein [Luteolibacter ambystomatis]|uniref:TROVE domain-containing protein n=1 Tax=Luteolibacter ambystomatis TaxID=2824561 RepID=A0A975IYS1_9BACT|nr:TROVE domain-containing protein [Luteolibacter ambystomatis]QUE50522.1 TROVE domain-containing protein [Luteolibacter ambystomatis]